MDNIANQIVSTVNLGTIKKGITEKAEKTYVGQYGSLSK